MELQVKPIWQVAMLDARDASSNDRSSSDLDEATLCVLRIQVNGSLITRIVDEEQRSHDGPRVSAYRFAEWLIWNWWRLRWEPLHAGQNNLSWRQAHETASIGGGWLWPKITFESDGATVCVRATGSEATVIEPITYVVDDSEWFISAEIFEKGIDSFVTSVLSRLKQTYGSINPLSDMWVELLKEREDPNLSEYRRLEAISGNNPDDGNAEVFIN